MVVRSSLVGLVEKFEAHDSRVITARLYVRFCSGQLNLPNEPARELIGSLGSINMTMPCLFFYWYNAIIRIGLNKLDIQIMYEIGY